MEVEMKIERNLILPASAWDSTRKKVKICYNSAEAIINCGFSGFPQFSGSGNIIFGAVNLLKFLNIKKYQIIEVCG